MPIDLSFLNEPERPAGRRGFVHARGDTLVFDDGSPARFWGTNLTANALFGTAHDEVPRQARRLARLGFNLVRMHHHDSVWVTPNVFGAPDVGGTRRLDAGMLDRLDWWIKCLADEGIYLWLDLHVGRRFTAADGIDAFDEIRRGDTAPAAPFNYVNGSIRSALKQFNTAYLSRMSRYTHRRLLDEPAVAAVLITNENDLTHHFGNALLPDAHVPEHTAVYLREAEDFARRNGLAGSRVWQAWQPGPAKIFLNDLEERFDADMIAHLRGIGLKVPIATTSTWGGNPLSSLPALSRGDLIDAHAYGGPGELRKNPLQEATLAEWLAAARVVGMPLTVSEWGVEANGRPAEDRQDLPLYVAGMASLQGWSAVMSFAYAEEPLTRGGGSVSQWQAYNDPAWMAALPAAALLFRRGDVAAAATSYVFAPGVQALFDSDLSAGNSVLLRTAAERGRLEIALPAVAALPWLRATPSTAGGRWLNDPSLALLSGNAERATSDGGELTRDWGRGIYLIDTPRTQAVMGRVGGKPLSLSAIELSSGVPDALVAVQSLTREPIAAATRLLITATAGAVPKPAADPLYEIRPLSGELRVTAPPALRTLEWDVTQGTFRESPAPRFEAGRYIIDLASLTAGSWLVLCKHVKSNSKPHESRDELSSLCQ